MAVVTALSPSSSEPSAQASGSLPHVSADGFQKQRDEDDDENEIDFRDHRRVADIGAVAVFSIDEARNRIGSSTWSAGGHVDDNIGELQLENGPEDDGRHADRQHER